MPFKWVFSQRPPNNSANPHAALRVLATSEQRQWQEIKAAIIEVNELDQVHWSASEHVFWFFLSRGRSVRWNESSVIRTRPCGARQIFQFSAGKLHEVSCRGKCQMLVLAIPHELVQHTVQARCGCQHSLFHLPSRYDFHDADVWYLGQQVCAELLSREKPDRERQWLLNLAVSEYLWRSSSESQQCPVCRQAQREMRSLHYRDVFRGIQQSLEYIQTHLADGNIGVDQIAAMVGESKFHFTRKFRAILGVAPHQYLLERRLTLARQLLETTDLLVTDIAYQCGFSSPSHMSTVFRRLLDSTPTKCRQSARAAMPPRAFSQDKVS